jgi:hypothetical protein
MAGPKVEAVYELNPGQVDWIKQMAEKYDLDDQNKALRVIIDYVLTEADESSVFEDIRCLYC